jgi:hypothetical protein
MTHTQTRRWIELDESPILVANAFLVQHEPHEFVLTVGQGTGPLVGTPDLLDDEPGPTRIHAMARFGMTRERAQELVLLLQEKLEEHDRMVRA